MPRSCSSRLLTLALLYGLSMSIPLAIGTLGGCGDEGEAPQQATPQHAGREEAEPAARVAELRGDVETRRPEGDFTAASAGRALYPADLVRTGDASEATVSFLSGAEARMGPESMLRIPNQVPDVTRLHHSAGQLFARATGPAGRRVEVELPPGTLVLESSGAVEGAAVPEAQVNVDAERVEVAMLGGEGTLRRDGDEAVRVAAGRYIAVDRSGQLLDEGLVGEPVVLLSPADGGSHRTRDTSAFAWRALEGVSSYRLEFDGEGAPAARTVSGTSATASVPSGVFRWRVRGLREGVALPPSPWRTLTVDQDTTAPELTLFSPRAGASFSGPVRIAGRTEPGARVTVDGRPVPVQDNGAFAMQHNVRRGLSNVVVSVVDDLGNRRVVSRSVLRR